jgi:predicted acylesterase/phospholipase RssA
MIMYGAAVALDRELKSRNIGNLCHCGSSGGSIVAKLMASDIPNDERLQHALNFIPLTKYARVGGWAIIRNIWNACVHGGLLYWKRVWEKAFIPMFQELKPNGEPAYAITYNLSSSQQMIIPLGTKHDAKAVASSCALQGWISTPHWSGRELREAGVDPEYHGMGDEDVAVTCDGGTSSALALEEAYTVLPPMLEAVEIVNTPDQNVRNPFPPPVFAIDVDPLAGVPKAQFDPTYAGNVFTGGGPSFIFRRFVDSIFATVDANKEQSKQTNQMNTRPTYFIIIETTGEYTDSAGTTVDLGAFGKKFEATKEEATALFEYGHTWMEQKLKEPVSKVNGLQGALCRCDGHLRDYTLMEALEHYFETGA